MKFFNSSCSLTALDYVTDFCIQQHIQKIIALYSKTQGVQKLRWKGTLFKRILGQDTRIIWVYYVQHQTDKYRLHKLFHYIFHHHHHISVMELGHLLTRSGLTYPEVSSKVCHNSFCHLGNSVSLPWVIYYGAFYLHVVSSFSLFQ